MTKLDDGQAALDELFARFYGFGDGLIRRAEVVFADPDNRWVIEVSGRCMDAHEDDDGWKNVEFTLGGIQECTLRMGNFTSTVIYGAYTRLFDGIHFLDFQPAQDEPETLEELRASSFYVAARTCDWIIKPYSEDF